MPKEYVDNYLSPLITKIKDARLKPEEEYPLILAAQAGDEKAMTRLLRANIKLIIGVAKRHRGRGLDFEELFQEACTGFIRGIKKFDVKKGVRLSTYTSWWLRASLTNALDDLSRAIRVPVHKINESRIVRRFYRQYVEDNNGETPDSATLEKLIGEANRVDPKKRLEGLTKAQIEKLGRILHPLVYLDEPNSDDENLSLQDYLEAPQTDDPEVRTLELERKQKVDQILSYLEPGERIFVKSKFGFYDRFKDRKEMMMFSRLSDEQVDYELNRILRKLRTVCEEQGFDLQGLL